MPFLRVVRDKRGYETTYLIHQQRDGEAPGNRVLYVFRSPGSVHVGRDAFTPAVRRDIEGAHPTIRFEWDALLAGSQVVDSTPEPRRVRRRPAPDAPSVPAPRRVEPPPAPPRLHVPALIEGDTPELRMRFLAHWHGILCEQLPTRVADQARRDMLLQLAQRLNPAGWVDADEIAAGLQQASEALEQLSRLLSRRRRKARRGRDRGPQEPTDGESGDQRASDESQRSDAGDDGRDIDTGTETETGDEAGDGE